MKWFLIMVVLVACKEAEAPHDPVSTPPVIASPPPPFVTIDAPTLTVDASSPTEVHAGPDARDAGKVVPSGMRGSTVPCKTEDDCWSEGATPIARPKSRRGKKFKPCSDGEWAPSCGADGTCMTMGYRC